MKCSIYIATSLDGFIAREDGDVSWLDEITPIEGEDFGYHAFMESVDVLIMGRNSFEKVLSFGIDWPYGETPVVVLSRRPVDIPPEIQASVAWMTGTPTEIVSALDARGYKHAYIDGGVTIQRFLAEGLIQRLIITRIPRILGRGIPLFGPHIGDQEILLKHIETRSYTNGMVQHEYLAKQRTEQ